MVARRLWVLVPVLTLLACGDPPVPETLVPPEEDPRTFGPAPFALAERADTISGDTLLSSPSAVVVLPDGKLVVEDPLAPGLFLFSESGDLLHHYDERGQGPGEITMPMGIAVFPDGVIWVHDAGRLRMIEFRVLEDRLVPVRDFGLEGIREVPTFAAMCGLGDRVVLNAVMGDRRFVLVDRDLDVVLEAGPRLSERDWVEMFASMGSLVRCFPDRREFVVAYLANHTAEVYDGRTGELKRTLDLYGINHMVRRAVAMGVGTSGPKNGRPSELPREIFWDKRTGYVVQVQQFMDVAGYVGDPKVRSAIVGPDGTTWTEGLPRISAMIGDTLFTLETDLTPRLIRRFAAHED